MNGRDDWDRAGTESPAAVPPAEPTATDAPTPTPAAGRPRRHRRAVRPGREQPVISPTSDDADLGWGDRPEPDDGERLRREVPPHWGKD
ncbi:hypothetical protein [Actinotalea fermentans]|uniref:Uncharacterized protein n=1 Tax=Actinotalea fermentans TaxID=43671 RepID=A0A511YX31_9CELL|nr:hypothetical protein [Actinotalea fermentans]GEN79757.1 hypothetical protein AFE02nite_14910 [Actinotalea fermentans]